MKERKGIEQRNNEKDSILTTRIYCSGVKVKVFPPITKFTSGREGTAEQLTMLSPLGDGNNSQRASKATPMRAYIEKYLYYYYKIGRLRNNIR